MMKIKPVKVESIENPKRFLDGRLLTKIEVEGAIEKALKQLYINIDYFGEEYPTPATFNNTYKVMDNTEWTNGFWTGCLWLAYEYNQDKKLKNIAHKNVLSFLNRINNRIALDHHDLGFLYTPSCTAEYRINGDVKALEATIKAADKLMERYQEKGGFIQAWGELGYKEHYRLIIDCLLNIQLLFFAYEQTGDEKYRQVAVNHFYASANNVVRDDSSAFHTFYFDPETGEPLKGVTAQTIFIIVKDLKDVYRLVAGGVPIKEINIGNIHNGEGKEQVSRSIFLGMKDKEIIRKLNQEYHIAFNTKTTPTGNDGAVEVNILDYI